MTAPHQTRGWANLARLRVQLARQNDERCCRCGKPIDYTLKGNNRLGPTADHLHPLGLGGETIVGVEELGVAHNACNSRHGGRLGSRIGKRNANRNANRKGEAKPVSWYPSENPRSPLARLSPKIPNHVGIREVPPVPFTGSPRFPDLAVDGLPSVFPAPHREAVGSLGDVFAAYAEARMRSDRRSRGSGLRWWQWLVAQRVLEVKHDGSWCWPVSFVSVSRQCGKSQLAGELAIWRAAHPDLFGGVQEVASSASTVVLSRLIQSQWWPWADTEGLTVRRQLGDSSLGWPDGSRWVTVAPENMYGRSQDLALIDEAWSWAAEDWWQATWPTLVERPRAQAVLWSAAHDAPRSLVGSLKSNRDVCVMEWGATAEDDVLDRTVWRAASAYWSAQRESAMLLACAEPSFASQWLNLWPESKLMRGAWGANLAASLPERSDRPWSAPLVLAVESDFDGRSWGAAASDGVHVVCVQVERKADAVQWLLGHSARASLLLCHDAVVKLLPQDFPVPVEKMTTASAKSATSLFRDAIRSGTISWDGVLAEQLQVADVSGGHGMEHIDASRSRGSVSAVKAAAWCLWKAATTPAQAFFSA